MKKIKCAGCGDKEFRNEYTYSFHLKWVCKASRKNEDVFVDNFVNKNVHQFGLDKK